ncbi:TIGR02186 family protein [Yoonia sp. 208BN28-4]|uniref:TIGR02186 family protein n=1 Tax=Yoonia sp. 208BN28-4 TaxID=3126505 RepID=UPI0030B5F757
MLRLLALLLIAALPAKAEEIVLGLSRDEVAITANFDGSDILIFGAISREAGTTRDGELGVIITVAGPDQSVTVRRKDRRLGIWVNTDAVEIGIAPSFYAVATNAPLAEILLPAEDASSKISLSRAIRAIGPSEGDGRVFADALIRIRKNAATYQSLPGAVSVEEDTLFYTDIELPANLTEGDYRAEIYLTRDGKIVDVYVTTIPVQKVGLERWLYNLAHDNAILYGLMSLAIAIAAGWGASAIFTALKR